jgi:hypothetical protein
MKFKREWLDLDKDQFQVRVVQWFTAMNKPALLGGYLESTRRERVQAAVDVVADYAKYREGSAVSTTDYTRNPMWNVLTKAHMTVFKEPAPRPSLTIPERIKLRNLWAEKRLMLETKIELLKYWESAAGQGFLQGDPADVQHTLTAILEDAKKRLELTLDRWGHVSWRGVKLDTKGEVTRDRLRKAVSGELEVEAGARTQGELTLEWKSVKGTFKYDAFAGLKAKAAGSAAIDPRGLQAEIEANLELGLRLQASATIDTDYVVVGGDLDAFAGALARASATLEIGRTGISAEASASAFAGVKATTKGRGMIKWMGREVFGGEVTAEVTAGAGGQASFALSVPIMGPAKFELSASTTLGVGLGSSASVQVNLGNIKLSGEQFLYEKVRQVLVPREQRYQLTLTMGDRENKQLFAKVKEQIEALLKDVKAKELAAQSELTKAKN